MKKFLVIYGMSQDAIKQIMENSTPEEQQKEMAEWKKWMDTNQNSFADVGGPAGKNTRVTGTDAVEVSNEIGGYSIMQGESKEAVLAVLKSSPHVSMPGTYTEVMELVSM